MSQEKLKGPVLVIGGGIAGMQSALSLAEAGHGVHLVERMATLGGMIPHLHRIYPLCACCKLDPRVAACEQNPNIQVKVNTRVLDVQREGGRFAVTLEQDDQQEVLSAGAVVLAAGIETFDPSAHEPYGYGKHPNVVTSVEYEQMQKPLGPQAGVLQRPSDGKTPQKIAWLQCVGSRDINRCDAPYCSSVCCMYALKEAVNTKAFQSDIDTAIFFMDMRTHGKGYEAYLNNALSEGVRLVRSRIHSVESVPETGDLMLHYVDEGGQLQAETFDMVVLSVGLRPSAEAMALAQKMGLALSPDHFIATGPFQPVSTSIPGVFVAGGLAGPHDIGQSVIQATASMAEIAAFLQPEPFAPPAAYPPPLDVEGTEPSILFAYHLCPNMDSGMADHVAAACSGLPGITQAFQVEGDILAALVKRLEETGANRLLFGSCTPVIHKSILEEALRRRGLNPALCETVDLRLMGDGDVSTRLKDRLRMGAARAALLSGVPIRQIPVAKAGLVVGGGVAGLESALALSRAGFPVTLVEKDGELGGGHSRSLLTSWQGHDAQAYLKDLIAAVRNEKNISVLASARVKESRGFKGNFVTTVAVGGQDREIPHGVTILAPGVNPVETREYACGTNPHVYRWSELGLKLEDTAGLDQAETIVFVQCVGSREPDRPYCSNICCTFAVRTALDLKNARPERSIYILYRDMRTFGERENLYREAREKGIIFVRYDLENKPVIRSKGENGPLEVTVYDPVLQRPIVMDADVVSLQTALSPVHNQELADIFHVNLDENGFFAEAPEKLRPVDTSTPGIFMAGPAAYPKDMTETIAQARAASARALEVLSLDTIAVGGLVAEVLPEKCAVCCTCVRTCPFEVPFIDRTRGAAFIEPGLCRGCGICVAECPGKAIVMSACSDAMLIRSSAVLLGG